MIKLNLKNLEKIDPKHGLSKKEIQNFNNRVKQYLDEIEQKDQGFYQIIEDKETLKKINKFSNENKNKFQDIVVLGIGGSALGTICLKQSLTHLFKSSEKNIPQLHIIDNIDPILIKELEDVIDLKKTLFIVITKSGSTPETLSQYFYFRKKCLYKKINIQNNFVFITDPKNGFLRKHGIQEKITLFDIPKNVGGRFSVLTPVGLLPAALIGINIKNLIKGASKMKKKFLSSSAKTNLSFQLALLQYLLSQKGKSINVLMPYSQKLIRFADWYRQLLAESIGKEKDNQGKKVNIGITPINSLGVTDQHSQSQLYNEGPNDKLIIFIEVKKLSSKKVNIPFSGKEESLQFLKKTSFNHLIAIEKKGTEQALTSNDRPNITIEIEKIDEETLGELFMLFQGATAFLGELFNINAFDQPGVELSKILTKKLLDR